MNNKEILDYVEDWLKKKRIKRFFQSKKEGQNKYIKMKEEDLYEFCYKLIDLIKSNTD